MRCYLVSVNDVDDAWSAEEMSAVCDDGRLESIQAHGTLLVTASQYHQHLVNQLTAILVSTSCLRCTIHNQICMSRISISTKLKLYNICILPILLYGSECWAVTKRDVLKIDTLNQWCLRKLSGTKWHQHMWYDEMRRTTRQPHLSAIVQARRLSQQMPRS